MEVIWLHSPFTTIISLPASWVRFVYRFWGTQFYAQMHLDTCLTFCSNFLNLIICILLMLFAVSATYNLVQIGCWAERTTAVSSAWTTKSNISTCPQMARDSCQSCIECPRCAHWPCLVSGYKYWLLPLRANGLCSWGRLSSHWRKCWRSFKNWGKITVILYTLGVLPHHIFTRKIIMFWLCFRWMWYDFLCMILHKEC